MTGFRTVLLSLFVPIGLAACRDLPTDPATDQTIGAEVSASAEQGPSPAREDQVIPNRYIVILKPGSAEPADLARDMAASHSLNVRHVYSYAIRGFAAEFPEAAQEAVLRALENNPNVRYVEQDKTWHIDAQPVSGSVTGLAAPVAPSDLSASALSTAEVALSWTDNSSDESGFQVSRCVGSGCTDFIEVGSTGKNKSAFNDTGLVPDTEYCYEVKAVGGRGRNVEYSASAGPACATTLSDGGNPPPAAEHPTDLTATEGPASSIDLVWRDNWDAETGFEIERCVGSGCSTFGYIASVGTDVTSYSDTGIGPGQEYCYRVRAVRDRGKKSSQTEYSNTACASLSVIPPSADPPTNLLATATSSTTVDLTWTDNSDESAFEIERCAGSGCSTFGSIGAVGADVTSYTDHDLTPDEEACYRVRGVVDGTPTGFSNTSCATPESAPPRFIVDSIEDSPGVSLQSHVGETGATWTRHASATGNAVFAPDGAEIQSSAEAVYTASGLPPGPDYRVASRMHFYRPASGAVTYTFVSGRADESARTMYMFGFVYSWVNRWELKKLVNGVETLLGYSTEMIPSVGDTPLVELRLEGSSLRGAVNGYEIVSVVDDEITNSGRAGLRMWTGDQDFAAIQDFEATTLDLAPPPIPPSTDPPSNLVAAVASGLSVGLSWTDNSDEDSFEVERCEGTGCAVFAYIDEVSRNVRSYTDTGLTPDVEVCYRVRGIVEGTPTGYSNIACALPESAPPRFVQDDFEDAPATLLQSHVGAIGAAWTVHPSSYGNAEFAPNGSEVQSSSEAVYIASGLPSGPDYRVASWVYFHSAAGPAVTYTFVTGRVDEASKTMYMFGFVYSSVNRWELKKYVNGVETLLGHSTDRLPLVNDVRLVELQMEGSSLRGVINGYEVISAVDGDIGHAGRAGLRMLSGSLSYAALEDFEATTLELAPPPIPPSADPPTDLAATALTSTNVSLSWTDNSDEEFFEIERCTGPGCVDFAFLRQVDRNQTTHSDTGLTPDTEVCYRVRGIVEGTPTDYSNQACATPVAPPPGTCPDTGNHDDLSQLWGISRTRAAENPTWLGTQNGGDCAIRGWYFGIDSGVDTDHPDLNVVEAIDYFGDGSGGEDGNGHGTHTAGTAAAIDGNGGVVGMAPGAPVYGFKVCGDDGSCSLSAIIAAVDEVTARKIGNPGQPMVANMSLGGDPSPSMDEAVRRSVATGVVYAIGAGNGLIGACWLPANAANYSPAQIGDDDIAASGISNGDTRPLNGAITVTSSNENDGDDNCNFGPPVTVAAPGTNILSTYKDGTYNTTGGTSMATPHAAGAALLYLQHHPDATPAQVEAAIVSLLEPWSTDDLPNASGRLNAGGL